MNIRFVIGRAGSGKSKRCFDAIVDSMRRDPLGPAIFWILPKQLTFSAERELTCASGLPGFCRAYVISFEELGREVLEDCGGGAVPQVTELGRQMILGHLLRKHEGGLHYFRSVARQPGLAARLDEIFSEFQRSGRTSSDLSDLLSELASTPNPDEQDQSLLAKLHDLRLLFDAYSDYLGQDRLDPHRRLLHVLSCIESWQRMQGADAYVDGFLEFSEYERRVITSMARVCRSVEVTMLLDPQSPSLTNPREPDELNPFHRTEQAYYRLWRTLSQQQILPSAPVILREVRRFHSDSLQHVESSLWSRQPEARDAHDGVTLLEAPDRRMEVDAAARQVRDWVREGMRYRDIAVLARDLSDYHELVEASFREHDIPHFIDRRRTAAHHPLLQLTRAVFQIALHNWTHDAMMVVVKSGMSGLSLEESDELENYVLLHRLHGEIWKQAEPWIFRRQHARAAESDIEHAEIVDLAGIDSLRRRAAQPIIPFVQRLHQQARLPIREIVAELVQLYERIEVRRILAQWMQRATELSQIEQHDEHLQVWSNVADLLDELVDLMGEEPVSPSEFVEILEFGLERFDLAITPPTVDQVLVGAVDRTRNPQSKAVIVLGMNDGQFPRALKDVSILSDAERGALRERLEIERDTKRQLFDETLLAYVGFTRASHKLVLTRALADEQGRPQLPSPFWDRLGRLFSNLTPRSIPRDDRDRPDCIGTTRQLVTRLMRWVRDTPEPTDSHDSPWPPLYQWIATQDPGDRSLGVTTARAWKALSYANQASLSPEIAAKLVVAPLRASISRLETFAACPFKHFARYTLALEEREDPDVTALDLGNVYHEVLEKIVREMIRNKRNWTDVPADQRDAAIKTYAREVGQSLRGELMLSSARNRYLLDRIERTLSQVIASHESAARRGRTRPHAAELTFGIDKGGLPAFSLTTPRGREVCLRGKIDRVDLLEEQAAFAVIDYKLSGSDLELRRIYHGLALQLLTYLLVLSRTGEKLTPAGAFYVRLMRRLEAVVHPSDPPGESQEQFRGIVDARFVSSFDSRVDGWSSVLKAYVKKDGTPGYRGISDAADTSDFSALLRLVERRLAELSDQIIDGDIRIAPYRLAATSPCAYCDYRSVCRFELQFNRYHVLEPLSREQVLEKAREETAHVK